MKCNFLLCFVIVASAVHGQVVNNYSIRSIDSILLPKYYIVEIKDSKGNRFKVFTKKDSMSITGTKIKIRKHYSLVLQEISKDSLIDGYLSVRKARTQYYINGKLLFDIDEKAFGTKCLNGLMYEPCK
jgi:hypothetical protein